MKFRIFFSFFYCKVSLSREFEGAFHVIGTLIYNEAYIKLQSIQKRGKNSFLH